jgi:hypothetical protein
MGIFVGPAVAPAAMAILMETANGKWCTIGAMSGLVGGIATWLIVAAAEKEEITIASLGGDYPFLWSNVVSICFSGLVAIAGSMANPDSGFRWGYIAAQLPLVDDMPAIVENGRTAEELDNLLTRDYKKSLFMANFLFIFLCLIFPMAIYWSGAVFNSAGFATWIWCFLLWCLIGGATVIIMPITDFMKDLKEAKAQGKQ